MIIYLTTCWNFYYSRGASFSMLHEPPDQMLCSFQLNWSCWRRGRLGKYIFQSYFRRRVGVDIVSLTVTIKMVAVILELHHFATPSDAQHNGLIKNGD